MNRGGGGFRLRFFTSQTLHVRKLFAQTFLRTMRVVLCRGRVLIAPAAIYVQVTGIEIMPEARNSHPMQ
jgi:hypothetical protein